jgi:hypothetical protein
LPYVEWTSEIRGHHKIGELMLLLKITRREAVGIVGCISSWAIQYRPGGEFEKKLVASAVEWEKDPKLLVAALLDAGWLDEVSDKMVRIHDWEEVTRGYRKAREDARIRTLKSRIARGTASPEELEEAEAEKEQPKPDRSSDPYKLVTDIYCKVNPLLHKRGTVEAKIRAAVKAGANLQEIEKAVFEDAKCKDVEIWDLLKPLTPNGVSLRPASRPDLKEVSAKLDEIGKKFTDRKAEAK